MDIESARPLRAVIVNCTLKPSPQESATEALGGVVAAALRGRGVDVEMLRAGGSGHPAGRDLGRGRRR